MEIKYEDLKAIVIKENISGMMMVCEFKAPNSAEAVTSSVSALEFQGNKSKMLTTAKVEAKNVVSSLLRNFLQRVIGYYAGGSAGRVFDQGLNRQGDIFLSKEEKEKAVVKAFELVAAKFEFSEGGWKERS